MDSVPNLLFAGAIMIPLVILGLVYGGDRILARVPLVVAQRIQPWAWLAPTIGAVGVVLLYPTIMTVYRALTTPGTGDFTTENITWLFSDELQIVFLTTLMWLLVLPVFTVIGGLMIVLLLQKIPYERVVMTIIIIPTAMSFTAAAVIWRQFLSYQPAGAEQLGTINALWTLIPGNEPVSWLQTPWLNTLCLILIALWCTLGVSALILSAALKSVPAGLSEAAMLDGASALRILISITLPSMWPSVLVVYTTAAIFALKVFDIVYVVTNGAQGSDTLANRLYRELFERQQIGHASAIAVVLLVASLPVVALNIRQLRSERSGGN
jgi:alpha-glucoside transport system permease protein